MAKTEDEYVQIAVQTASDVASLSELRMGLRELMLKSPVCDGAKFTTGLEATYRRLWRSYCSGDPPPSLRNLEEELPGQQKPVAAAAAAAASEEPPAGVPTKPAENGCGSPPPCAAAGFPEPRENGSVLPNGA